MSLALRPSQFLLKSLLGQLFLLRQFLLMLLASIF
jgi:hypothetical protein